MLDLYWEIMLQKKFPRGLIFIISDNNAVSSIILGAIRPGLI